MALLILHSGNPRHFVCGALLASNKVAWARLTVSMRLKSNVIVNFQMFYRNFVWKIVIYMTSANKWLYHKFVAIKVSLYEASWSGTR